MSQVRLVKKELAVFPVPDFTGEVEYLKVGEFVKIDFTKAVKKHTQSDYWYEVYYRDDKGNFTQKGYALISAIDISKYPRLAPIEIFKLNTEKEFKELPAKLSKTYAILLPGTFLNIDTAEGVRFTNDNLEWYPTQLGESYGWVSVYPDKFNQDFVKVGLRLATLEDWITMLLAIGLMTGVVTAIGGAISLVFKIFKRR